MQITSLYIENFGVLHAYRLDLHDGLNIICENNGFGKTTLAAFIKAMLYGLPISRKADLSENERKKYQPWQGGVYGGSLSFSVGEKQYRAERSFAVSGTRAKNDTFVLYDCSDNTVSQDYSENLGLELFGIDAEGFSRSAFLPQRVITDGIDNATVTAKLNHILDAGDDVGRYEDACAILDKRRQYYLRQGGRGRIADLEESLKDAREQLEQCGEAEKQCAEYTESIARIDEALDEIKAKDAEITQAVQALAAERTRMAVASHGSTLLAERNALLELCAQKQRFLGENTDPKQLDASLASAEQSEKRVSFLTETIRRTEEHRASLENQLQKEAEAAESGRYPDDGTLEKIRLAKDALLYARHVREQTPTVSSFLPQVISGDETALPECLSDAELERHIKQAAVFASTTEQLSLPMEAVMEKQAAFTKAGFPDNTVLPDEETMDAYADGLRVLSKNEVRRKTVSDAVSADEAALLQLPGEGENGLPIPEEQELVSIHTQYDNLAAEKREIDALEEKQHLAAAERNRRKNRQRGCIAAGVLLLLIGVLFLVFCYMKHDLRYLIPAGVSCVLGIISFGYAASEQENAESRVLDDDICKQLCEKKSEYEHSRTAVYEFLDRYADHAVLDADEAERIFRMLSERCRRRETLRTSLDAARAQLALLDSEDAEIRGILESLRNPDVTAPTGAEERNLHGTRGVILTDTEDDAVFTQYRASVRACRKAADNAAREAKERADCKARANALRQTLDAYLAALWESPAAPYCPEQDSLPADAYLARLQNWKTAADMLRSRIAAQWDAEQSCIAAEARLNTLLSPYQAWLFRVLEQGTTEKTTGQSEDILSSDPVRRAEILLQLTAQQRERVSALQRESEKLSGELTDLNRERDFDRNKLERFLSQFYGTALPKDLSFGVRSVAEACKSLTENRERLRTAQEALRAFCRTNGLDEEAIIQNAQNADDPDIRQDALNAKRDILRADAEQLRLARAAQQQKAESASAKAAERVAVQERIADYEEALADAKRVYQTVITTKQYLDTAKAAMATRYLSVMQNRFRAYYAQITGLPDAEAEKLTLDRSLLAQMEVGGVRREDGYFSRGTADLVNLCIRLALIDALFDDHAEGAQNAYPPLVLDDPFVNLDNEKLTAARRLLDTIAERYQILYLVCHESRC